MIAINVFGGATPGVAARLLADSQAVRAVNCRLGNGDLAAFAGFQAAASAGKRGRLRSIRRTTETDGAAAGRFLQWTETVDAVRGPAIGDARNRTFFTGAGAPRVTDPALCLTGAGRGWPLSSRLLGVPAPKGPPEAQVRAGGRAGAGEARPVAYCCAFVNAWNEEGPPGPASAVIQAASGQSVDVYGWDAPPAGDWGIVGRRLYRTHAGSAGAALWRFVAELDVLAPSCLDEVPDAELGETLASQAWTPPPADLAGLTALSNGMMAGFRENEIWFSEPFRPHAWPAAYRLAADWPIRALSVFGSTLVAVAEGAAYLITGSDPASMSMSRLPGALGCVSGRGMASVRGGALYPTAEGLCLIGAQGAELITAGLLGREDWQALNPASLFGVTRGGCYLGFYATPGQDLPAVARPTGVLAAHALGGLTLGGVRLSLGEADPLPASGGGFVLDLEAAGGPRLTMLDVTATAACVDPRDEALYLARPEGRNSRIDRFDAGDGRLPYVWRSKEFALAEPVNLAAARVEADCRAGGELTFTLLADGRAVHSRPVSDSRPFRLPGGYLAEKVAVELAGTATVKGVWLGASMADLAGVVG